MQRCSIPTSKLVTYPPKIPPSDDPVFHQSGASVDRPTRTSCPPCSHSRDPPHIHPAPPPRNLTSFPESTTFRLIRLTMCSRRPARTKAMMCSPNHQAPVRHMDRPLSHLHPRAMCMTATLEQAMSMLHADEEYSRVFPVRRICTPQGKSDSARIAQCDLCELLERHRDVAQPLPPNRPPLTQDGIPTGPGALQHFETLRRETNTPRSWPYTHSIEPRAVQVAELHFNSLSSGKVGLCKTGGKRGGRPCPLCGQCARLQGRSFRV